MSICANKPKSKFYLQVKFSLIGFKIFGHTVINHIL